MVEGNNTNTKNTLKGIEREHKGFFRHMRQRVKKEIVVDELSSFAV